MDLVLGADGGGSRTRLALARLDGERIATGTAGPANPHDVGWEGARAALAAARERAFADLGRPAAPVAAAAVGLAGVGSAPERERALALLDELALAPRASLRVLPDLEIAWMGAFAGAPGIVLVAGTGSVAYGRDANGSEARAGGWGPRLDDAGSATWIAREALAAAARAADGRGAATRLSDALCEAIGCADFLALRARLAERELARDELASLALHVLGAARDQDEVARDILERAAAELASLATAVARALGRERPAVAVTGGLVAHDSPLREALRRELRRSLPLHEERAPRLPPLGGALLLALEQAGIALDEPGRTRLASGLS